MGGAASITNRSQKSKNKENYLINNETNIKIDHQSNHALPTKRINSDISLRRRNQQQQLMLSFQNTSGSSSYPVNNEFLSCLPHHSLTVQTSSCLHIPTIQYSPTSTESANTISPSSIEFSRKEFSFNYPDLLFDMNHDLSMNRHDDQVAMIQDDSETMIDCIADAFSGVNMIYEVDHVYTTSNGKFGPVVSMDEGQVIDDTRVKIPEVI